MATRKNIQTASAIGTGSADTIQPMLLAGKSNQEIANAMGCSVAHLLWAMALPTPVPLKPLNWTDSPSACPFYNYDLRAWWGVVPQVYSGPSTPGYTYGAPVAAREDFS